jgi:hypothetical protein
LFSQNTDYFQQEANYKINVSLDDKTHVLSGDISIEYHNNSPKALTEIWMHLWGNAYKNQRSEFAKQQLRSGKKRFFFSKDADKGKFDAINFQVNGSNATWEFDKNNPDIAVIRLAKPLESGDKLTISTPFTLKIPASFSRLGHVGESYQITQWYPKPAVYDNRGWHAIPYLNQGEFYSEFGKYDVSITLPENYVVGASGVLQTAAEKEFLQQQIEKTKSVLDTIKATTKLKDDFPTSAEKTKTIRYIAENVHDFAWFADKRFYVTHDVATLSNGQNVDCYAMFTNFERNLWTKGAFYIKRSVEYYSKMVGNYPYPHATAVQSALSAGGGMEYPMITVIDKAGDAKSLDIVITHEVGHNWFYGILASNEREHGWMDEGMNSYYEERYTAEYYPKEVAKPSEKKKKGFNISISIDGQAEELGYQWFARQALDQPCGLHSNDFTGINYGLVMYKKTAKSMRVLEQYVGTPTFDRIMKQYFDLWKFKHPYPEDFRKLWENETKGKDISWFFDGLINSDKNIEPFVWPSKKQTSDNSIGLTVGAKGNLSVPIPVTATKNGKVVHSEFVTLPKGNKSVEMSFPKGDYDKITADFDQNLPARMRYPSLNGEGKSDGKYFLPKVKMFNLIESTKRPLTVGVLPAFAYNLYDKQQLGLVFYSSLFPSAADGYTTFMPLYSFEQKQWNGMFNSTASKYFEHSKIRKFDINANFRRFSYDYNHNYNVNYNYNRIQIGLGAEFSKKKLTDSRSQRIDFRSVGINNNYIIGKDIITKAYSDTSVFNVINELKYTLNDDNILKPLTWTVTAQQGKGFAKVFMNFKQKIQTDRPKEAIFIRAFAGAFLYNNNTSVYPNFMLSGRPSGLATDYMYDNLLFARSSGEPRYEYPPVGDKTDLQKDGGSFFSQQVFMQDAGFKTLGKAGYSDSWMASVGLAYNLPLPLPISFRPYVDFAVFPGFDDNGRKKVTSAYSTGIATIIVPDVFEIYFPLPIRKQGGWSTLESDNLDYGKRSRYSQKISFLFNLNYFNPYERARTLKLNL